MAAAKAGSSASSGRRKAAASARASSDDRAKASSKRSAKKSTAGELRKARQEAEAEQAPDPKGPDPRYSVNGYRLCDARTKSGALCRQIRLVDNETGEELETCLSHASREARDKRGFGGSQPGAGRPARIRVQDVLRERIEEHADEALAKIVEAMQSGSKVVVVPGGKDNPGWTEEVADMGLQLKAAQDLMDRAIGKPKSGMELTGPDEGPVMLEMPSSRQRAAEVVEVLRLAGALPPETEER